jgi:hypothetical protein
MSTPDVPSTPLGLIDSIEEFLAALCHENRYWNIASLQSGKFLTVKAGDPNTPVMATSDNGFDKQTWFRFDREKGQKDTSVMRILSTDGQYLSAVGEGWRLFPKVEDAKWSFFVIERTSAPNRKTITIRSTAPEAAGSPYVSVVGPERVVRICEKTARIALNDAWSGFVLEQIAQ